MHIQKLRNQIPPRPTRNYFSGFRPCTFHRICMSILPNYMDEHCRNKRHPKFTRVPQTVNPDRAQPARILAHHNVVSAPQYNPNHGYMHPNFYPFLPLLASQQPQGPPQNYFIIALHDERDDKCDSDQYHSNIVKKTFNLDFWVYPTHSTPSLSNPPPITHISTVTAASSTTPCTHAGRKGIALNRNYNPSTILWVAPKTIHSAIFFVHSLAQQHGVVFLAPDTS